MKFEVTVRKEIEVNALLVEAGVRYWEDAAVDGVDDEDGNLIPCRKGDCWCPIIELETGKILNWTEGITAEIHYKVCDAGAYSLLDHESNVIAKREDCYVPSLLCPSGAGYGDYIVMHVNETGVITGWKPDLSFFDEEN
jgi:hypothetical protein